MSEFRLRTYIAPNGKEFETESANHVFPCVVGKGIRWSREVHEILKKQFPNHEVLYNSSNYYFGEENVWHEVTFYYVAAYEKGYVHNEYIPLKTRDFHEFDYENTYIECTVQVGSYSRTCYMKTNVVSNSLMSCVDDVIDYLMKEIGVYESGFSVIELYDRGGWSYELEGDKADFKEMIVSIRYVELEQQE